MPAWTGARWLPAVLVAAVGLGLLATSFPPPAQDWPQHVATAHVLATQLTSGVAAAPGYAVALQPVPYHLLWLLLVPCVAALGVELGATACLVGLYLATVWVYADAARRLSRSPWCVAVALPAFFSANFAWGFAPTWAGLPALVFCLGRAAACLRGGGDGRGPERGGGRALAFAAAAACAAHVLYVPAVAVIAVAVVLARPRSRPAWVAAFALGAGAAACVTPWAWQAWAAGPQLSHLRWETPTGAVNHLHSALGCFERGLGRGAHAAVLAALAVRVARRCGLAGGRRGRPLGGDELALSLAGAGLLGLAWLVPLEAVSPAGISWLLGIRLLPAATVAWALAPSPAPGAAQGEGSAEALRLPRSAHPPDGWLGLAGVACFVYALGVAPVFCAYGRAIGAIRALGRQVPPGARVAVEVQPEAFGRAWPPLLRHAALWSYADGAAYVEGLFQGGHLPLRATEGCRVHAHDAAGRLALGDCSHVWLALPPATLARRAPEATGLVLLGEAVGFRLYGPARVNALQEARFPTPPATLIHARP